MSEMNEEAVYFAFIDLRYGKKKPFSENHHHKNGLLKGEKSRFLRDASPVFQHYQ